MDQAMPADGVTEAAADTTIAAAAVSWCAAASLREGAPRWQRKPQAQP
jgi:hypothetical protein